MCKWRNQGWKRLRLGDFLLLDVRGNSWTGWWTMHIGWGGTFISQIKPEGSVDAWLGWFGESEESFTGGTALNPFKIKERLFGWKDLRLCSWHKADDRGTSGMSSVGGVVGEWALDRAASGIYVEWWEVGLKGGWNSVKKANQVFILVLFCDHWGTLDGV